ncbi:MAG: hypothetical protein OXJ52_09560 [Oligoflexia bacterium]|nr:hypothetical protein [Oligoflexia bacterium]
MYVGNIVESVLVDNPRLAQIRSGETREHYLGIPRICVEVYPKKPNKPQRFRIALVAYKYSKYAGQSQVTSVLMGKSRYGRFDQVHGPYNERDNTCKYDDKCAYGYEKRGIVMTYLPEGLFAAIDRKKWVKGATWLEKGSCPNNSWR